jgi:hypothetical protein
VEQLKFQLRVDAEELSAEQKTRLQLEQEMAELKRQLDKEASMKNDIEGQLAISSEVRQELEQRAERIRHSLQQCVSSPPLSPLHSCCLRVCRLCVAHDTTRHDTTRHDTTRHDTTRHDTTRHDTTRHDTTHVGREVVYCRRC